MRQKRHLEEAVKDRTSDLEREKTELVRTREQMRHFAEHDGLTGLWNHRIIVERLRGEVDRSLRDGTPLSIILVDLDYFKRINDAMGHVAGDLTLRETGGIFQRSVRSYDWVGRYGGERSFCSFCPDRTFEAAKARAEAPALNAGGRAHWRGRRDLLGDRQLRCRRGIPHKLRRDDPDCRRGSLSCEERGSQLREGYRHQAIGSQHFCCRIKAVRRLADG